MERWKSKVKRFNKTFALGTPVIYYDSRGIPIQTVIEYPAFVMYNNEPFIGLEGILGVCPLQRVVVI